MRIPFFMAENICIFFQKKNTIYRIPREEIAEVCDFLEYMERCPDGVCEIAKEDIQTFCQGLLPVLEEHFKVKKRRKAGITAVSSAAGGISDLSGCAAA